MSDDKKTIGKYIIEGELGEGGMGTVYLSKHPTLGIPVAIKTLNDKLAQVYGDVEEFRERFIREAQATATLNHTNIVRVYDADVSDDLCYMVMEFVGGGSVKDKLDKEKRLSVNDALDAAIGVARALVEGARHGIIHRDIKPGNILLTEDGVIKLADLGLARFTNTDKYTTLTTAGTSVGSPHYIAPEQALNTDAVDARADIYSLGATLYHLLAGCPPFDADTSMAVMIKHLNEPLPPLKELNANLPPELCAVVHKMMEKAPEHRYQTAAELLEDLEVCRNGDYSQLQLSGVIPSPSLSRNKSSKKTVLTAFLGATAVCMLIAIIVLASQKTKPVVTNNDTLEPEGDQHAEVTTPREPKKITFQKPSDVKPVSVVNNTPPQPEPSKSTPPQPATPSTKGVNHEQPIKMLEFRGHQYALYTEPVAWPEAQQACQKKGGHLVCLETPEEEAFIRENLPDFHNGFWLGMSDSAKEGQWKWVNGKTVTFNRWFRRQPDGGRKQNYAWINPTHGPSPEWWSDISNTAKVGFICEVGPVKPGATKTSDVIGDRMEFGEHTYQIIETKKKWRDAYDTCKKMGGYLVRIDSAEENAFISQMISKTEYGALWIDLTDRPREGKWLHGDGTSPKYTNWGSGQPDNYAGDEHWARIRNSKSQHYGGRMVLKPSQWEDWADHPYLFICEWDTVQSAQKATTPVQQDIEGTKEFNGHTYKYYDMALSHGEAKLFAKKKSGYLVTINSPEEHKFVTSFLDPGKKVRIGMYAVGDMWHWEWETGEYVTYTAFRGAPVNGHPREIVQFRGTWHNFDSAARPFVVEWGNTATEKTFTKIVADSMPEKRPKLAENVIAEFRGHHYKVYAGNISWLEAQSKCAEMGGHLATFSDKEENDFVKGLAMGSNLHHVGLMNENGKWQWVDGTPYVWKNWARSPGRKPTKRNPLIGNMMGTGGVWHPAGHGYVSNRQFYVCEWDY